MNICIFGGAFNPIHISHTLAIHYISSIFEFDKIFIVPTYSSPTGKELIDFNHRIKMIKLAINFIPNVIISDIEEKLSTPSYSINTVRKFKEIYPEANFRFVIGADVFLNKIIWNPDHLKEIFEIAPPLILARSGYNVSNSVGPIIPEISSTKIRDLIKKNNIEVEKFVPRKVLKYIKDNKLYE